MLGVFGGEWFFFCMFDWVKYIFMYRIVKRVKEKKMWVVRDVMLNVVYL